MSESSLGPRAPDGVPAEDLARRRVRAFLRGPLQRPVSVATNTGDGLRMAMRAGALLGTMREARWVAAMTYGGHGGTLGPALVFGYRADRSRWEAPALVPTAGG